jgi:hypothetical protein
LPQAIRTIPHGVIFSAPFRGARSANPESRANNLEIPRLSPTAHPGMTMLNQRRAASAAIFRLMSLAYHLLK